MLHRTLWFPSFCSFLSSVALVGFALLRSLGLEGMKISGLELGEKVREMSTILAEGDWEGRVGGL